MNKKIYFVYRFAKNPNPEETYRKLEKKFGKGYLFGREHPDASTLTREQIRKLFTNDMKNGKFDLIIVDVSYGRSRFMEEEVALAKKLNIPVIEVNLLSAESKKGEIKLTKRK
jgi:fatty acid-binding protein DegV